MYRRITSLFILASLTLAGCWDGKCECIWSNNDNGNAGVATLVLEAPVDDTGGVIAVDDPGSPIYGTKVRFPEGCVDEEVNVTISYKNGTSVPLGEHAFLASKIIQIETDIEVELHTPVVVTIPVIGDLDQQQQIMLPFHFDEETGMKRVLVPFHQPEGDLPNAVSFVTGHFSEFGVLGWTDDPGDGNSLVSVSTGFNPALDGFFFKNFGSFFRPGTCAGMSIYAAWYYNNKVRTGQDNTRLYAKYRQGDADLPNDDNIGFEVAMQTHNLVDYFYANTIWDIDRLHGDDSWVARSIVAAMAMTGAPQIIDMGVGNDSIHAVTVYGFDGQNFLIYDPNFPTEEHQIGYNAVSGFSNYDYRDFSSDTLSFDTFSLGSLESFGPRSLFEDIYNGAEYGFDETNLPEGLSHPMLPEIIVTSHVDGQIVTEPTIQLEGAVTESYLQIYETLDFEFFGFVKGATTQSSFDTALSANSFSQEISLELGPNVIYLYAGSKVSDTLLDYDFVGDSALRLFRIVYAPCLDADGDGYGDGPGCLGNDCDDEDPAIWTGCVDCVDGDSDGYGVGADCLGADCDDSDPNIWTGCTWCVDADSDGHNAYDAINCPTGTDYCDGDVNNWTAIGCTSCADADGDGYGTDCDQGDDCDDGDPGIWTGCPVSEWTAITAGRHHACTLKFDGTVWCWGDNWYGQLGDGTNTDSLTPVEVIGLSNVDSISSFYNHTCAVLSDGTVWCWGDNQYGQLGDGSTTNSATPVQSVGLSTVVAVGVSNIHSCALLSNGLVYCWGRGDYGALGNGSGASSATPAQVSSMSAVVYISVGYSHSCVIKTDGTVWCWGGNTWGQLGDGTTTTRYVPVLSTVLSSTPVALSTGYGRTCSVEANGTAWCWGNNDYGVLGDGTTNDSTVPVQVLGLTNVEKLVPKEDHTCAVKTDGTAWCWGYNYYGQLGDGTTTDQHSPVEVIVASSILLDIALGDSSTCGIKASDGSILCWGVLN